MAENEDTTTVSDSATQQKRRGRSRSTLDQSQDDDARRRRAKVEVKIPSWREVEASILTSGIDSNLCAHAITLTPELATVFLSRNFVGNRHVPPAAVQKLARTIADRKFRLNGESLKFSDTGYLLDGQTRCRAVIETGMTIETVILTGLPESAFDSLDQGRKRLVSDALARHGVEQPKVAASMIKIIDALRHRTLPRSSIRLIGEDADEAVEFARDNPRLAESIKATKMDLKKLAMHSLLAALHFAFCDRDVDAADQFFSDLNTGSVEPDDVVRLLRDRMINYMQTCSARREKRNPAIIAGWTILTWNARRNHEPLKKLPEKPFTIVPDGLQLPEIG